MKQRSPAFQFYPRQFAGDDQVMAMDLDAIGAHILLMCAAAASPEGWRINADEYAIRMRIRNPSEESWQRIKKQLLAGAWKMSSDNKWWVQDGLRRTLEKQKNFSEFQRKRANKKWHKEPVGVMPDAYRANAAEDAKPMAKVCSSSSSSSASSKGGAPDLSASQLAKGLLEEIDLPISPSNVQVVAAAIEAHAKTEQLSIPEACTSLENRAVQAHRSGQKVNKFWFEDGKYNNRDLDHKVSDNYVPVSERLRQQQQERSDAMTL